MEVKPVGCEPAREREKFGRCYALVSGVLSHNSTMSLLRRWSSGYFRRALKLESSLSRCLDNGFIRSASSSSKVRSQSRSSPVAGGLSSPVLSARQNRKNESASCTSG